MRETSHFQGFKVLACCAALLFFSCNAPINRVMIRTEMGDMSIDIFPHLPSPVNAAIEQLAQASQDSLSVEKVLQNGYIQLNYAVEMPKIKAGRDRPAISGAFALCRGRFFIVQGRAQTEDTLDKWEQGAGQKIPRDFRELYKRHGGTLQLEGKCLVLGKLIDGTATLNRIAAIPSDADGRPLRSVALRLEGFR